MKRPAFVILALVSAAAAGIIKGPPARPATSGYYGPPALVGYLSTTYPEPSGIARPHRYENRGYMWMHQDSGGPSTLLAVSAANAATAGSWTLQGVSQNDWEDCASARVGGVPYLYVGDIGDNASARATVTIYRCVEPVITGSDSTIPSGDIEAITCAYPAGNTPALKDCECLLADPADGALYLVTKRIFPAQIYSLPHAATYSGTQTLTYVGKLAGDSSATSLAIATGSRVFTTTSGLSYAVGTRLRAASAANAANFMAGEVTAQSGTSLTISVTTVGGTGTLADWQIGLDTSLTPTGNNGCITGGAISEDGRKIALCNYGHPYGGAAGQGSTGLFIWTRGAGESAGAALLRAPQLLKTDTGGGQYYPHSNPGSYPQREAVEFDTGGENLYVIGEYYSAYGTTVNPFVRHALLKRQPVTLALQNGLNGYTGCVDTMLGSTTPTTDNNATASLVADIDYNATTLTISSIQSFSGGTQIAVTCNAPTGMTPGNTAALAGCSVSEYNGTWVVDSVSGNEIRLRRSFTTAAGNGTLVGHTGASGDRQTLVKWTDLSGVPAGATIVGAKVVIYDNTEGKGWTLNRMLAPWSGASTWNSLTSGVTCDGLEAAYAPDATILPAAADTYVGFYTINVPAATVQGWVDGTLTNEGWTILGYEESTGDGFQWDSSESATQARRPMLILQYTTP